MRFAAAALCIAALTQPAIAQDAAGANALAIAAATQAADSWLALLDEAKHADSWTQGAAMFRGAVTPAQWDAALRAVRSPLGAVKSRKLTASSYTRRLPGAPDGEYVVLQYQTDFANRAGVTETVTPMREPDGSWKVSGWYVK